MSNAVILGSAFADLPGLEPQPRELDTPFGPARLWRHPQGWVLFRHGRPHRYLPHQIPYRAQAWALKSVGTRALLVTSSCGLLDPALPPFRPMLVGDLLWLDQRLPDGSACSMFQEPGAPGQGHLVLEDGICSSALREGLRAQASARGLDLLPEEVVFAYISGPRTKTPAENRALSALGAQVNSMSLGPELVLASELEIPALGLVVGHKASQASEKTPDAQALRASLVRAKASTLGLVEAFLDSPWDPPFANHIYRFD